MRHASVLLFRHAGPGYFAKFQKVWLPVITMSKSFPLRLFIRQAISPSWRWELEGLCNFNGHLKNGVLLVPFYWSTCKLISFPSCFSGEQWSVVEVDNQPSLMNLRVEIVTGTLLNVSHKWVSLQSWRGKKFNGIAWGLETITLTLKS